MTKQPRTDPDKMLGAADQHFDGLWKEFTERERQERVAFAEWLSRKTEKWSDEKRYAAYMQEKPMAKTDDAEVLRRAAEILRDRDMEGESVHRDDHGAIGVKLDRLLEQRADKLEAPPPPKTFTTEWTNADPRPFSGNLCARKGDCCGSLWMELDRSSTLAILLDPTLARHSFRIYAGQVWPADLYWTRLPEVDDA